MESPSLALGVTSVTECPVLGRGVKSGTDHTKSSINMALHLVRRADSENHPMAADHCRVDFVESLKLAGTVLAALIASRTIWAGVRARYRKGWGSRKVWRRKLNLLANGATADYVKDLLGTPVFENHQPPSICVEEDEKPKWVDHVFSTPHAWVVTRRIEDRLEAWSVTITDPKFWWELADVTFQQV